MINKLKIQLLVILMFFTAAGLKAQQINFSGYWIRNTEKCDAGDLSINSIPIEIKVIQSDKEIQITRISKNVHNDTTNYAEKIKFDGSSGMSTVKKNLNKKSEVNWSPDQKEMIESASYIDDQGNPVQKVTESWEITDQEKTLVIKTMLEFNGNVYNMTEVYDLKN